MKREEQIEEMHLDFEKWDDADTELSLAEWMYNLGYRKASEIFEEIESLLGKNTIWLCCTPWKYNDYEKLKKKYGVGEKE